MKYYRMYKNNQLVMIWPANSKMEAMDIYLDKGGQILISDKITWEETNAPIW